MNSKGIPVPSAEPANLVSASEAAPDEFIACFNEVDQQDFRLVNRKWAMVALATFLYLAPFALLASSCHRRTTLHL